jgi:acetyl-CoA acetyltransferase
MEFEGEFGFTPPAFFALVAEAYMRRTGATPEVLAQVAVKNRAHAQFNPYAPVPHCGEHRAGAVVQARGRSAHALVVLPDR